MLLQIKTVIKIKIKVNPAAYHYNNKGIDLDRMIKIIKLFVEQIFKLLFKLLFKVLFKLVLMLLFRLVLIKIVELAMVMHFPTGERHERSEVPSSIIILLVIIIKM